MTTLQTSEQNKTVFTFTPTLYAIFEAVLLHLYLPLNFQEKQTSEGKAVMIVCELHTSF